MIRLLRIVYRAVADINRLVNRFLEGRGRLVILTAFVVCTAAILPRSSQEFYQTEVGRVWQEPNLAAPYDLAILKSGERLQQERQRAAEEVSEVFLEEQGLRSRNRERLIEFYDKLIALEPTLRTIDLSNEEEALARVNLLTGGLEPMPDPKLLVAVLGQGVPISKVKVSAISIFDSVYRRGYIDKPIAQLRHQVVSLRASPTSENLVNATQLMDNAAVLRYLASATYQLPTQQAARLAYASLVAWCKPNYLFNDALYQAERAARQEGVSPYYGKVRQGQLVVARGQSLTPEISDILHTLNTDRQLRDNGEGFWIKWLGQLLLVIILTIITAIFLRSNRKEIYFRNKKIALIFLTYFLMTLVAVATLALGEQLDPEHRTNFYFLVPLSMGGILICVFFDARVGFFSNIVISLLASLVFFDSFEYFFIQTCAGSIAVFNVSTLRRRAQFFTSSGALVLTYWATYVGYHFTTRGTLEDIYALDLAFLAGNVVLTLATYPLIYVFERVLNMTSDLTYMELLDTDHPLLKELALKAPGTYQHSLQVANIAEEIAKRLDANTLEARVGALFHDIGKLERPEFFRENQRGSFNPHDSLSPIQSAEIIIRHVMRGKEIAEQAGLPNEIIRFILTHHGNSKLEFFAHKHSAEFNGMATELEEYFRYLGPLPTSKEEAIVMVADSIEAASRTLQNPTPQELEAFVDRIISNKIRENQLVHARITFRDLNKMKREIVKILQSIYHSRIQYPDQLITETTKVPVQA